ncbi:MAG TPA: methyl-accepting chemotaxis protein [Bacillales bacterium]
MKKTQSLRRKFFIRVLLSLITIVLLSGFVQLYFIQQQIADNVENQANLLAHNIMDGISKTETAAHLIEHQIDLKMIANAKYLSLMFKGKSAKEITNADLIVARDQLGLEGITLFARKGNDIVGVKATEPTEIGFSFKQFGEAGFLAMSRLLKGKNPAAQNVSYQAKNIVVLPIAQSGSHDNEPVFNKYAYYHPEGSDYIIDPYIEANQVYKFTKKVGPDAQIQDVLINNPYVKEIAVLHPKVFKDPSLAKSFYSPLKKVEYGTFKLKSPNDVQILKEMAGDIEKRTDIETINGKKYYQMFIPAGDSRMIYIAYDYQKMSTPLYRHSIILIVTGLLSLIVLFLVTARFFNRIYRNIQRIKGQLQLLEEGDLTAVSEVHDGSELEDLSKSTNRMAERLHQMMRDTQNQADKTERLSVMLESEASESVEKMYQLSTETTMKSREQFYEITEFLDEIEQVLHSFKDQEGISQILEKVKAMREVANDRTAATTEMTMTLSDLLKSLHGQSSELSEISSSLLEYMEKFKL